MNDFEVVRAVLADWYSDYDEVASQAFPPAIEAFDRIEARLGELEAELAERSRIIDTLHLRSMSNTIQDGDALAARLAQAERLLRQANRGDWAQLPLSVRKELTAYFTTEEEGS